jgi:hypothetical protein
MFVTRNFRSTMSKPKLYGVDEELEVERKHDCGVVMWVCGCVGAGVLMFGLYRLISVSLKYPQETRA